MKNLFMHLIVGLSFAMASVAQAMPTVQNLAGKKFVHTMQIPSNSSSSFREYHWWLTFSLDGSNRVEVSDDFWISNTPDCDEYRTVTPCVERQFLFELQGTTIQLIDRIDGKKSGGQYTLSPDGLSIIDAETMVYTLLDE